MVGVSGHVNAGWGTCIRRTEGRTKEVVPYDRGSNNNEVVPISLLKISETLAKFRVDIFSFRVYIFACPLKKWWYRKADKS